MTAVGLIMDNVLAEWLGACINLSLPSGPIRSLHGVRCLGARLRSARSAQRLRHVWKGIHSAFAVPSSTTVRPPFGTYVGGKGDDWAVSTHNLALDGEGNVGVAMGTASPDFPDFPTTPDALQAVHGGDRDAYLVVLSANFDHRIYSTYMGGRAFDTGRSACLGPQGDLCLTGAANGPGWPVKNAVQATFAGTNDGRWGNGDCIVARFRRATR